MNPARSLGPVLAGAPADDLWIYVVGPLLGALVAVAIVFLVQGRRTEAEAEDAQGRSTKEEQESSDG